MLYLRDFLCTLLTIPEDLPMGRPNFSCRSSFYYGFEFLGSLLDAGSSLRSDTELEDELEAGCTSSLGACSASFLNESCDGDAEDARLSGIVDSPGTTRGTKLSVLHMILFPSLVNDGF